MTFFRKPGSTFRDHGLIAAWLWHLLAAMLRVILPLRGQGQCEPIDAAEN
jgi:hypothetical protein